MTTAAIPSTMKAAVLRRNGDPLSEDVWRVQDDVPVPTALQKGEILIRVAAAAINPVDWKLWRGDFPGLKQGPVGCDLSGTVVQMGPDTTTATTGLQIGDQVYADAFGTFGAFAEYARVKAIAACKKPTNIDMMQAASLPLVGLTALQGLVAQGGIQAGYKVCVLGGSSGVGSLAIQMAKALGASQVWATGTSIGMIQDLGADKVINYKEESIADAMKGQDFDIVYDTVGGVDGWKAAQGGLKKGGTFVTIVGDGGGMPYLIGTVVWRKLRALFGLGHTYKLFMKDNTAPAVVNDMMKITELVQSGKVKPVLDGRTFELTAESVHALVEASMSHRAKGKLILKVNC